MIHGLLQSVHRVHPTIIVDRRDEEHSPRRCHNSQAWRDIPRRTRCSALFPFRPRRELEEITNSRFRFQFLTAHTVTNSRLSHTLSPRERRREDRARALRGHRRNASLVRSRPRLATFRRATQKQRERRPWGIGTTTTRGNAQDATDRAVPCC